MVSIFMSDLLSAAIQSRSDLNTGVDAERTVVPEKAAYANQFYMHGRT